MRTIGRTSVAVTVAVAATLALAGSAAAQDKSVRSEVLPKGWATAHGARGGATAAPADDQSPVTAPADDLSLIHI